MTGNNALSFKQGKGTKYYTGKLFPSTVTPTKLFYFVPYIKGRGIRDLYLISKARVGSKHEVDETAPTDDYRLVFDLQYIGQLFDDYKPVTLDIWHTFRDTTIRSVLPL